MAGKGVVLILILMVLLGFSANLSMPRSHPKPSILIQMLTGSASIRGGECKFCACGEYNECVCRDQYSACPSTCGSCSTFNAIFFCNDVLDVDDYRGWFLKGRKI